MHYNISVIFIIPQAQPELALKNPDYHCILRLFKNETINRLKRARVHLAKVQKMLEDDEYCPANFFSVF
jgi:hypothetical protein